MFDRRSQFDRSFFDRTFSQGPPLPARIAGVFDIITRTGSFSMGFRAGEFEITERTEPFKVVASK